MFVNLKTKWAWHTQSWFNEPSSYGTMVVFFLKRGVLGPLQHKMHTTIGTMVVEIWNHTKTMLKNKYIRNRYISGIRHKIDNPNFGLDLWMWRKNYSLFKRIVGEYYILEDRWIDGKPLNQTYPKLYNIYFNHNIYVAGVINNELGNIQFQRTLGVTLQSWHTTLLKHVLQLCWLVILILLGGHGLWVVCLPLGCFYRRLLMNVALLIFFLWMVVLSLKRRVFI